ncbi:MAG: PrgI family protein [Candidatus Gracilibacteria bacterium]|nr:PrgI family protein [Candidatus Gracilibacteria bacterium]
MRYKVPQNVQRADQILWFLTLRQVIILVIGGAISYLLYSGLSKQYELNTLEYILISVPAALAAAFAFLTVKGVSLPKFILLLIEQTFFRPPRRRWVMGGGEPFVSTTTPFSFREKTEPKPEASAEKDVSPEKLKNFAHVLDSEGTSS